MGFFWSRAPPALTQEYQESIAHRVRDILTGADHSSHAHRNKLAIKALQRPEALAGVIEILKSMPEPCPKADGWHVDEGIDMDSDDSSFDGEQGERELAHRSEVDNAITEAVVSFANAAAESKANKTNNNNNSKMKISNVKSKDPIKQEPLQRNRPDAPTVVAATTIAAAAATSAAAATLAVTVGRKKTAPHENANDNEESAVERSEDKEAGVETTVTKASVTLVKFRPSKDTVSSHAYWWGYEIFIPQDALSRIGSAQDVSSAFLGFLGSVGLVVPAIVPFLGYIAAYVGLEFAVIKAQNEGKGVILASTWLVPVALVPRAWDVPDDDS
ncbi:hypothetical protein BGZ83_011278 [Gryganskiella cystojenkinii]|nr:hypothetical protein BGZ83_011278 [Gryganskiella cystojenkinii]